MRRRLNNWLCGPWRRGALAGLCIFCFTWILLNIRQDSIAHEIIAEKTESLNQRIGTNFVTLSFEEPLLKIDPTESDTPTERPLQMPVYRFADNDPDGGAVILNGNRFYLCTGISKERPPSKDATFQYFVEKDMYIYSAYLDTRLQRHVVLLGFSGVNPSFYCQFYYSDGNVVSVAVSANKTRLLGKKDDKFNYFSHMYICEEPLGAIPEFVSLTSEKCISSKTEVTLPVHYRPPIDERNLNDNFLIVVKYLYNLTSPYRLIEFIEMQRILGADKMVIYDYDNVAPEVAEAIEYYRSAGFVDVYPWKLPVRSYPRYKKGGILGFNAQHAQIHDGLYRWMNRYKYMLFIDIDEFIIARDKSIKSYQQIVQMIRRSDPNHGKVAAYVFANSHHCMNDKDMKSNSPELLLTSKLSRNQPDPFYARVKSIVNPRFVSEMGVHTVVQPLFGYRRDLKVAPSRALLHHYRKFRLRPCNMTDTSALHYADDLVVQVNRVCIHLGIDTV